MAACMDAATGCTVKKAFGNYHRSALKMSDSMVALHWIGSKRIVLQTWVHNRVVEIYRLSEASEWKYVESSNMVADLGTMKKVKILDLMEGSNWINGLGRMNKPEDEFPTQKMEKIKLNKTDSEEAEIEIITSDSFYCHHNDDVNIRIDKEIQLRYRFSNYLIEPNRFRFRKVARILGLVPEQLNGE